MVSAEDIYLQQCQETIQQLHVSTKKIRGLIDQQVAVQEKEEAILAEKTEQLQKYISIHTSLTSNDPPENLFTQLVGIDFNKVFDILDPAALLGMDLQYDNDDTNGNGNGNKLLALNKMEVMCPYEVSGICNDEFCKFWHIDGGYRCSNLLSSDLKIGKERAVQPTKRREPSSPASNKEAISPKPQKHDEKIVLPAQGFSDLDDFIELPEIDSLSDSSGESSSMISEDASLLPVQEYVESHYDISLPNIYQTQDPNPDLCIFLIMSGYFGKIRDNLLAFVPPQQGSENRILMLYNLFRNLRLRENIDNVYHESIKKCLYEDKKGNVRVNFDVVQTLQSENDKSVAIAKAGSIILADAKMKFVSIKVFLDDLMKLMNADEDFVFLLIPALFAIYADVPSVPNLYNLDVFLHKLVKSKLIATKFLLIPLLATHIAFMNKAAKVHPSKLVKSIEFYLSHLPFSSLLLSQLILLYKDNLDQGVSIFEYACSLGIKLPVFNI